MDEDLEDRYGVLQKQYEIDSIELKRIFVIKEQRQQGLAKLIVGELEDLARIKGYKYALLETGIRQHEAINLYRNIGYNVIQNYGPYIENTNSICMKKIL